MEAPNKAVGKADSVTKEPVSVDDSVPLSTIRGAHFSEVHEQTDHKNIQQVSDSPWNRNTTAG